MLASEHRGCKKGGRLLEGKPLISFPGTEPTNQRLTFYPGTCQSQAHFPDTWDKESVVNGRALLACDWWLLSHWVLLIHSMVSMHIMSTRLYSDPYGIICICSVFRATSGSTLELVEESLDINLLNNVIQLKFQNCSLLPGGVHIFETQNNIVILISTNQTVHRLILPHPARMYRSVSNLFHYFYFFKFLNCN